MVAQKSLIFRTFCGNSRQRGRECGALAQTVRRTAIQLIKIFIQPVAKKLELTFFVIAAPDIGKAVSGRKISNCWRNMLEQKQFEKSWKMDKRNTSVEQEEHFLEEVVRKPVTLGNTI